VIKDEELDIETFDPDAEERGYEEAPEADAGASENPDGT